MDKPKAETTTSPSTGTTELLGKPVVSSKPEPTTPVATPPPNKPEPPADTRPPSVANHPRSFSCALDAMRAKCMMARSGWNEPDKYLTLENGKIICYRGAARSIWAPNQVDICALDWGLYGG